jgi:hypothetical protein
LYQKVSKGAQLFLKEDSYEPCDLINRPVLVGKINDSSIQGWTNEKEKKRMEGKSYAG